MVQEGIWKFKLYVTNKTPVCLHASTNLQTLCDERLKGKCVVEVIDILKNPEAASDEQIVAIPTLIKKSPLPARRVIGDLSNTERLLVGLDIRG
jgi:circadian clock protein KaiB